MYLSFPIPLILASTSPRRIQLLNQAGFQCEVFAPDANETPLPREKPAALVKRLSQAKAISVQGAVMEKYSKSMIIAADTIVVAPVGSKILGKPKDQKEAEKILRSLSDKIHTVFTGYCLLITDEKSKPKTHCRVVKSRVKMRKLSPKLIQSYIQSGEPMDKAGAYGAQGLGSALIEKISGSYTNVVGLPVTQVLMDFERILKIDLWSMK